MIGYKNLVITTEIKGVKVTFTVLFETPLDYVPQVIVVADSIEAFRVISLDKS